VCFDEGEQRIRLPGPPYGRLGRKREEGSLGVFVERLERVGPLERDLRG